VRARRPRSARSRRDPRPPPEREDRAVAAARARLGHEDEDAGPATLDAAPPPRHGAASADRAERSARSAAPWRTSSRPAPSARTRPRSRTRATSHRREDLGRVRARRRASEPVRVERAEEVREDRPAQRRSSAPERLVGAAGASGRADNAPPIADAALLAAESAAVERSSSGPISSHLDPREGARPARRAAPERTCGGRSSAGRAARPAATYPRRRDPGLDETPRAVSRRTRSPNRTRPERTGRQPATASEEALLPRP